MALGAFVFPEEARVSLIADLRVEVLHRRGFPPSLLKSQINLKGK